MVRKDIQVRVAAPELILPLNLWLSFERHGYYFRIRGSLVEEKGDISKETCPFSVPPHHHLKTSIVLLPILTCYAGQHIA